MNTRKPRSNSLRTPTVPSPLTQQPPPPWVQVCLLEWRIERRETTLRPTQAHKTWHTTTHTYTHGAVLSPHYAAPPMYKPRTAARRAGERARRRDVKTKKARASERREEKPVSCCDTDVLSPLNDLSESLHQSGWTQQRVSLQLPRHWTATTMPTWN